MQTNYVVVTGRLHGISAGYRERDRGGRASQLLDISFRFVGIPQWSIMMNSCLDKEPEPSYVIGILSFPEEYLTACIEMFLNGVVISLLMNTLATKNLESSNST